MSPTRRPTRFCGGLFERAPHSGLARVRLMKPVVDDELHRDAGMPGAELPISGISGPAPACRWWSAGSHLIASSRPSGGARRVDALGHAVELLGEPVARRGSARSRPAGGRTAQAERGFEGSRRRR